MINNISVNVKQKGALLFLVSYIFTCIIVLNGNYISTGYKIEVGQVSKEQLKATRDVENTVKFENEKKQIRQNTDKRYAVDKTINDSVTESITEFFQVADAERVKYKESINAVNEDGTPQKYESEKLTTLLNSVDDANVILTCSDEQYNAFKQGTIGVFTSALETGVKESDLEKNKLYIEDQFSHITESDKLNAIGISLYETFFKANLVEDVQATEQAINEQIANIEPQIYLKGQTIVNDGDIVNEEQYAMLKELGYVDSSLSEKKIPIFGILTIISSLFVTAALFFRKIYIKSDYNKDKYEFLMFSVYNVSILLLWLTSDYPIYLSPILASIALISIFYGVKIGIYYTIFIMSIGVCIVSGDIEYCLFILISGVFLSIIAKNILQRKNLYKVAIVYGFFNTILYFGISTLFFNKIDTEIITTVIYIFGQGLITVVFCFGMIPVFEIAFSILTPNKLLELSDPNNELMKRFIFEMPGTYHHSLVVANLSEVAAAEIGANASLARVGAYYHDAGKLKNPYYFAENQVGENPHDNLTPIESCNIIREHVQYGVEIGEKYKLPNEIIEMIGEHHGNTLVNYFYVKAKNEAEDPDTITEDMFRYKGRKPKTKESAILMLADTCEAAVRSKISKVRDLTAIESFVDELIKGKIDDGQLVDSGLTFGDVEAIKIAFMRVFKGMYHERVEYPKLKDSIENNKDTEKAEEKADETTEETIKGKKGKITQSK